MEVGIRPLRAGDRSIAQELVDVALAHSPYDALYASALATALEGGSVEARGLAAECGGALCGVAVFGLVAGSVGTGRVQLVAVSSAARRKGVATALLDAAVTALAADGARVVFVEMPDDAALAPGRALLLRGGFSEEARVADYIRDGVSLVVLRRDIA